MQTQMALAMNEALKSKGLPPKSQAELMWRYIKDHPGIKLSSLEKVFTRSTPQTLHSLHIRKMVTRTTETTLVRGNKRSVFCYKVAMPEYELLPLPAKPKKASAVQLPLTLPSAAPAPLPMPLPQLAEQAAPTPAPKQLANDDLDEYIDSLSVGKARKLYTKLKVIFG